MAEGELEELRNQLDHLLAHRKQWQERVKEGERRKTVAKNVYVAASNARAAILQRVFNESLNGVWEAVFTRLAPNEPFIPRFGTPTQTRGRVRIKLETVEKSGGRGGPPQMMLSAGNLNTAALSLFLALHLAAKPALPCLVFDDPVQAMDEVHVAQFAALIRVLSKNHGRQVVMAVHERELFDYLTLELSPAFQGDSLITIKLGDVTAHQDDVVQHHEWVPDTAIQMLPSTHSRSGHP